MYEKAASILSRNDPPVILAKVDASNEANKGLATDYKIPGWSVPSIRWRGDFQIDAIEDFIEEASIPVVTIFDNGPSKFEYVNKFFSSPKAKVLLPAFLDSVVANYDWIVLLYGLAMVFLNFTTELDTFKSKYNDVAVLYKGKELSFLLGDIDAG
ncbi:hypothetical protein ACH5RR_032465 [Cinchona calisaya]|uniref:protein disulfide-isomerase n=1 Tax=Cinchona calisaya TaxID=153742 RepID=A0ABD2YJA0_9GENT